MAGLEAQVSTRSRVTEPPSSPLPTEAQVAADELESVIQQSCASSSKAKPLSQVRAKRSSTAGMVLASGIVLGCVGLIVNWFAHLGSALQASAPPQGNLLQSPSAQPNLMQSPSGQPNFMQSLQPSPMGSSVLSRQPFPSHYQVPANLPQVGFRSRPLLAARGYRHIATPHQTKPASHTKKAPAKKPVQWFVPTKTY